MYGYATSLAVFSDDRNYRYSLHRAWDESLPIVVFIGLNPSTADELKDDPTIRRCVRFAKRWGYGGITMVNLFARCATRPADIKRVADPVGPCNNEYLRTASLASSLRVACWGVHGAFRDRDLAVAEFLPRLKCFGFTKGGHPKHPLYLRANAELMNFQVRDNATPKGTQ